MRSALTMTAIALAAMIGCEDAAPAPDAVGWSHDLEAAMVQAGTQNKAVLLDFTADWCPPCQDMARNVFSREEVAQAIRGGFVPVKIDLTRQNTPASDIARRYQVDSIPTFVIVTSAGQEQARMVGGRDAQGFLNWLKENS